MLVNMGGALSSLLGGAVVSAHDGDQSELELLMITQLCGESSDSCSGIHALVESGPIQAVGRGFALSYMTS